MGHDDDAEVQPAELEAAHKLIRSHLATRFSTFRRAFLMLDQDGDGKLSTLEMMRAVREIVARSISRILVCPLTSMRVHVYARSS